MNTRQNGSCHQLQLMPCKKLPMGFCVCGPGFKVIFQIGHMQFLSWQWRGIFSFIVYTWPGIWTIGALGATWVRTSWGRWGHWHKAVPRATPYGEPHPRCSINMYSHCTSFFCETNAWFKPWIVYLLLSCLHLVRVWLALTWQVYTHWWGEKYGPHICNLRVWTWDLGCVIMHL